MNEPSVALRQRRDLGEIIQAALHLYLQNFWPLFGIAAVVVPLGIASGVLQTAIDDSLGVALIVVGLTLLQAAVNLLVAAALIAALGDLGGGRPADFSHAYDVAFERFWTLLGAVLRVAAIVLLLFITLLGIPWAIQRAIRWLFVEQAVILDGTSARAALSYSADAVIGSWWRTFGIALVIGLIGTVPASIIAGVFALAPVLISATVSTIVNAMLLPFVITTMTLLYRDLQVRKEEAVAAGL